jgi:hypothetical protein
MNIIEQIKQDFGSIYIDNAPDLEGTVQNSNSLYNGRRTHCRSGLYAFTKIRKAKYVLEIGSWLYQGASAIARAMDDLYGVGGDGIVDSIDIIDNLKANNLSASLNKRIQRHYWLPHHTDYDIWKYNKQIEKPEFREMTNDQIFEKNLSYLKSIAPKDGYDIIMIDSDHSYEGAKFDWLYAMEVSNNDTLIIVDDLYDDRHIRVKKFFDELKTIKWDFKEWNDDISKPLQSTGITLKH